MLRTKTYRRSSAGTEGYGSVVGVRADVPVACLRVGQHARRAGGHADVLPRRSEVGHEQ